MTVIQMIQVHDETQTTAIIEAASRITDEQTQDPAQWPHVFNAAVQLLSARIPMQQAPLDLSGLALPGRH